MFLWVGAGYNKKNVELNKLSHFLKRKISLLKINLFLVILPIVAIKYLISITLNNYDDHE